MTRFNFLDHLMSRVIILGFLMVGLTVTSYIVQEHEAQRVTPTVCVASWDCDTGVRVAPRPDAQAGPR